MTTTDTTSALPSLTSRVLDANGRWNKIWAPWILRLLNTVRVTASDVQTITVDIDEVKGKFGVTRNVNGRISGSIQLDGTDSESTFAVLADKFVIVHPSTNGTTITAFIAGLVNGVPTVGINGDLLVDGTILARSLNVATLSAIAADVGTLTAGLIQSADGKMQIDLDAGTIIVTT